MKIEFQSIEFVQSPVKEQTDLDWGTVEACEVEGNLLWVKGLDTIDGTPVLDIKLYYPVYDRKADAAVPKWVDLLMEEYF